MTYAKPARDVQAEITATIIAQIEAGAGDWKMPWHTRPGDANIGDFPVNQDAKRYRGLNVILLWASALKSGYDRPVWGTFKNWEKKGGKVRQGEKGTQIFFWDRFLDKEHARKNPGDDPKYILYCKSYHVFNITQLAVIPAGFEPTPAVPQTPEQESKRIAAADKYFAAIPAEVRHGGSRAYCNRNTGHIQLPNFDQFNTPEDYYSTRGHETVHWSGHEPRLNREFGKRFGDNAYAFEELVAELGAAFLCAELGIANEPRPDHAQYLAHWLEVLKADKYAIFTAASRAQAAVDYLGKLAGRDTGDASGEGEADLPLAA